MYWKLTAGLAIALFAVSFAAALLTSIPHKNKVFQTISSSHPLEMHTLSAEEINRRPLQLAATAPGQAPHR
jgi:hypothetical protein